MRTNREGEWLGPIDWSYDFSKHLTPTNSIEECKSILRSLCDAYKTIWNPHEHKCPKPNWHYSPCFLGRFEIIIVGMYDGWPYWEPTPAVGYIGPLGIVEVAFFNDLKNSNVFQPKEKENVEED